MRNIYEPSYFLEHADEIKEQLEMNETTKLKQATMHKAHRRSVEIKGKGRRVQRTDKRKYHPTIIAMADAMQEKLEINASKKGWPGNSTGKRGRKQPVCSLVFLQTKRS